MWGLDLKNLEKIAAGSTAELSKSLPEFFEKGWLVQKENTLSLTQTGKLYADHIASSLFF